MKHDSDKPKGGDKDPEKIDRVTGVLLNLDAYSFLDDVDISKMFVAVEYGRPIRPAQLGRMTKVGFDRRKAGFVVLSMRADGSFAILDGNHRVHLARSLGWKQLRCYVFIDLTIPEEADFFEALNTTAAPTALDRFRSRIAREDDTALTIQKTLAKYGLQVAPSAGGTQPRGNVGCVALLDSILQQQGEIGLDAIIGIIYEAWDHEPQAWIQKVVDGVRQFWARYYLVMDRKTLIDRIKDLRPSYVMGLAGVRVAAHQYTASVLIGQAILSIYNDKLRTNRLPDWPSKVETMARPQVAIDNTVGRTILRRMARSERVEAARRSHHKKTNDDRKQGNRRREN